MAQPLALSRLIAGELEVLSSDAALDPGVCAALLSAARRAPPDIDDRHAPLESLEGGAHLPIAEQLVERLRCVGAYYSELRLQRAFCIRYAGDGDGHAAHVDPCAFTINVPQPALEYGGRARV